MKKLSPKTKIRWALSYVLLVMVILITTYALGTSLEGITGIKSKDILNYILIISFILLIPYLMYIEIKYRRYEYNLGEKEITIKKGIINLTHIIVPYEKIQNINSEMDLLSNILGIAKIKIETAGSNVEDSDIELPGIENPQEFISFVIKKVESLKNNKEEKAGEEKTIYQNKEDIENIKKNLEDIKGILNSLSQRFLVFEGSLNNVEDKLERMENINSMLSSRMDIVEKENSKISSRIDEVVENTDNEIEEVRKMIEKIKDMKKKVKKKKD